MALKNKNRREALEQIKHANAEKDSYSQHSLAGSELLVFLELKALSKDLTKLAAVTGFYYHHNPQGGDVHLNIGEWYERVNIALRDIDPVARVRELLEAWQAELAKRKTER